MSSDIIERAFISSCFIECTLPTSKRRIDLKISNWTDRFYEASLANAVGRSASVALYLQHVASIPSNVLSVIAKVVAPKLCELHIADSSNLSWKILKKMLDASKHVNKIVLLRNSWLTDAVVEQLTTKYYRVLTHFHVEQTSLTDGALFHLKRCAHLQFLALIYCSRISDAGLIEIAKNVQLSDLHITNNNSISDAGIEAILLNSANLYSLILNDIPNVTDQLAAMLYELNSVWGRKRNNKSQTLQVFEMHANPNISTELLAWLSLSSPRLVSLDIRDASGLDMSKAFAQMTNMSNLRHLKIGSGGHHVPTFDVDEFIDGITVHAPRLLTLHIVEFVELNDASLATIIQSCDECIDIALENMNYNTKTIEAIASCIPNVEIITFIGSRHLGDKEVRCVTSVCHHLKELTVKNCPRISDVAFSRCSALKLRKVDFSHGSKLVDGTLLASFTNSPLVSLSLENTPLLLQAVPISQSFGKMNIRAQISLREIVLRDIPHITATDVLFLLDTFIFCTLLDLTGCQQLLPDISSIKHEHRFLEFSHTQSRFLGFVAKDGNIQRIGQFFDILKYMNKERAARRIQRMAHRAKQAAIDRLNAQRLMYEQLKQEHAAKIQSAMRMKLARKRFLRDLQAARKITALGVKYINNQDRIKTKLAVKHYNKHSLRFHFTRLCAFSSFSKQSIHERLERLIPRNNKRVLRRYVRIFREQKELQHDLKFCEYASAIWEGKMLQRIINGWKTLRWETLTRHTLLLKVFMNCLPIKVWNSTAQRASVFVSDNFRRKKLLAPAWACFCDDLIRARKAELLLPAALFHFRDKFVERVVKPVFKAINDYRIIRLHKKSIKAKGDMKHEEFRKMIGCRRLWNRGVIAQKHEASVKIALQFRHIYGQQLCVRQKMLAVIRRQQRARECAIIADRFCWEGIWFRLQVGVVGRKRWRMMNMLAKFTYERKWAVKIIAGWRKFVEYASNIEEFMWLKYCARLQKKAMRGFMMNIADNKAYRAQLAADLAKLQADQEAAELEELDAAARAQRNKERAEEALRVLNLRILKLQSHVRKFVQMAKFRRYKIAAEWASQVIQNFARRALALRDWKRAVRQYILIEHKKQERELDLMREEEVETRYYNMHIAAIVAIQRVFRGWKGRQDANSEAVIIKKAKGAQFYQAMVDIRKNYERELRLAAAKELAKHRSATKIQSVVRGNIARRFVKQLRFNLNRDSYAVTIQRVYRGRLARELLDSVRRHRVHIHRYQAARRQRGLLLRMLAFKKRHAQLKLSKNFLAAVGFEPISFNYRVGELLKETVHDFYQAIEVCKREYMIMKETRGDKVLVINARRKYFTALGIALKQGDTVIVIQPGHKYYGYTGVVVRIDISVPGEPLYEVKLDHCLRQTFVHMTTDGLTFYMNPQPLSKVPKHPNAKKYLAQRRQELFTGSMEPEFSKDRIVAAWTIQQVYRMHRARKRVSRQRYEMWTRRLDTQRSLINQLMDTNTLTTQAYFAAGKLHLRPTNNILFDELRHTIYPMRLQSTKHDTKLLPAIKWEYDEKFKARMKFLEKAFVSRAKGAFLIGWQKITKFRKFALFCRKSCGYVGKGLIALKDMLGARGVRNISRHKYLVAGLNIHKFPEFDGSPHIRFAHAAMYQGEWTGVPLFTPLIPHGEGVVIFFDGWGFAREDKVLTLIVVACRHLNAADISTSDPFCEIMCNGKNLQTSVKWSNLNPVWNEKFEIDVTNPDAGLNIVVKDKDYIGNDDFLGQILISMRDLAHGKQVKKVYQLKGEELDKDEGFDRGEIELIMRWTDRVYDDEITGIQARNVAAVKLQCWARRIAAKMIAAKYIKEREEKMIMLCKKAVKITNTCRIRLARKEFKRRLRRWKAAIKIQKRIRIKLSRMKVGGLRQQRLMAIKIQRIARGYNARQLRKKMIRDRKLFLNKCATIIQRIARKMISVNRMNALRDERILLLKEHFAEAESQDEASVRSGHSLASAKSLQSSVMADESVVIGEDGAPVPVGSLVESVAESAGSQKTKRQLTEFELDMLLNPQPVEAWINTYGIDPEYYLPRNRRITYNSFQRLLKRKYARIASRYGTMFLTQYPPPQTADEELGKESLRVREDFVCAVFPSQIPTHMKRVEVVEMAGAIPYEAVLHIPSSVNVRASVDMAVTTIQCFVRQYIARQERNAIIKVHESIAKFQRIFRRRNQKQHRAAYFIQSLFYYKIARKRVAIMRLERKSIVIAQCAFRVWKARMAELDARTIRGVRVLKYSTSDPFHPPEFCFDMKSNTFWVVKSNKVAEIRIELPIKEAVDGIWIMLGTFQASPKYVTIGVVLDKASHEYVTLAERVYLPLKKGLQWIPFSFKSKISKYYKLTFEENHGDPEDTSIRQIRFVRAKEQSATILKQPEHNIIEMGPTLGENTHVELRVEAEGWPLPAFQWLRNGKKLPGETSNVLQLRLHCPISNKTRSYRCSQCKNFCRNVPKNAYQIVCTNCGNQFDYKEINKYFEQLKAVHETEKKRIFEIEKMYDTLKTMESSKDEALRAMLPEIRAQIDAAKAVLEELKIARYEVKCPTGENIYSVNNYVGEGIYTCLVMNYRGGSVFIRRKTIPTVVVIEKSARYPLKTIPFYNPRKQGNRKRWTIYSSLSGHFIDGKIAGIVTIRYSGGYVYEGPYVSEDLVDFSGRVPPECRAPGHWGIFTFPDGTIYEGVNVDNHFDPENIQGYYRMTKTNKEIYEGMFVDERFHGVGRYIYSNGNVYEGEWHAGKRYGHGHLRSDCEGWTYEGNFDNDMRHGEGMLQWDDGATYIGILHHDRPQGVGLYISRLRDVYKGDFSNGQFNGKGELIYNNGSKYTGEFANGNRHGLGLFIDRQGSEYFGRFIDDHLHGDHTVKKIVEVEGKTSYEISMAQYDMGKFVCWVGESVNPLSTHQFIQMFYEDREAFDGVYALLLTKYLPGAPRGIDTKHPEVIKIMKRIRADGGMLTGADSLREARENLERLLPLIRMKKYEIEQVNDEIDVLVKESRNMEHEKSVLYQKYHTLMSVVDDENQLIEQFWTDDLLERRAKYKAAVEALNTISKDDWFKFKNHRSPPPFVKRILDAMCYLLDIEVDWKIQQALVSDYVYNSHNGDKDAVRFMYDCKFTHVLKSYDVYEHAEPNEMKDNYMMKIISDPRFRRDSYYVESCGKPAPLLVDWIKTNYNYVLAARTLLPQKADSEAKRIEAFRFKNSHSKKCDEQAVVDNRVARIKKLLTTKEQELLSYQKEMDTAYSIVSYIHESYEMGKKEVNLLDYYEMLEKKIEAEQLRFSVETSMEGLLNSVEAKLAQERMKLRLSLLAAGEDVSINDAEEELPEPQIKDWLIEEINIQQSAFLEQGAGLGYSIEPGPHELTYGQLEDIMQSCVENILYRLNDVYHEAVECTQWRMPNGRLITYRFLYVLCWSMWKEEAEHLEMVKASRHWESIFGEPIECAKKSIQSKVNWRMSELARTQAALWAKQHPKLIEEAEKILAEEFKAYYPDDTATHALYLSEDDTGEVEPDIKALAMCYMRLYPSQTQVARDFKDLGLSQQFAAAYPEETALHAFQILNEMVTNPAELDWAPYAAHWRNFNSEEYGKVEHEQVSQMAQRFREDHVFFTNKAAAQVLEDDKISQFIPDPEVAAETYPGLDNIYCARSWGLLNQGLFRAGIKLIRDDYQSKATRNFNELVDLTNNFTKGSAVNMTPEMIENPTLDRFYVFRQRLHKRFAWLIGYLYKKQQDVLEELQDLANNDPAVKVFYNVRPSEKEALQKKMISKHLRRKGEVLKAQEETFLRIAALNTFFGKTSEQE